MNKQRKKKLRDRALAFAERNALDGGGAISGGFDGFQAGYRAAMRDARKAIFPADALDRVMQLPGTCNDQTTHRARLFLRPLR